MKQIYINNEKDLEFFKEENRGELLLALQNIKNKEIKFVFNGNMHLSEEDMHNIYVTMGILNESQFRFSVDINLNQNIDRSTIHRRDLISKEMSYFAYGISSNANIKCVFEKIDGKKLEIDGKYFYSNSDGHFQEKNTGDFSDEFRNFIEEIRQDKYDRTIECKSLSDIHNQIDKIKEYNGQTKLFLSLNKEEYNEELLNILALIVSEAKKQGKIIDVVIDAQDNNINVEIAKVLYENKQFNSYKGVNILYSGEYGDIYTSEETLTAMAKVKLFINELKKSKASPFEKYLMIYRYVSQRKYIKNEETSGQTRDLISILNNDDIVCAGYASLLKWICNEVGIECETQNMYIPNTKNIGHANNRVYIKDAKYGLDGWYCADATMDALGSEGDFLNLVHSYAHALIPIADVKNINSEYDYSLQEESLGVFYKNQKEFVNMKPRQEPDYISNKLVDKLVGEENHREMTEDEAVKKIGESVDVIERIMKKNSIEKYILDLDESKFMEDWRNTTGGVYKYVILHMTGCFSEEELEQIMIMTKEKYGEEANERHNQKNKSRIEGELNLHKQFKKNRLASFRYEKEFLEDLKINVERTDPDNLDIENIARDISDNLELVYFEPPESININKEGVIKEIEKLLESLDIEEKTYIDEMDKKEEEIRNSTVIESINKEAIIKELIYFAMEKCLDWQAVNEIFNHITAQSKPISLDNFYKAIIQSYIAQGLSREEAETKAKTEIFKSKRYAPNYFNKKAINCFVAGDPSSKGLEF